MGGTTTLIKRRDLEKITRYGGYADRRLCVVPDAGKLYLLESEDRQLLLEGVGFSCETLRQAKYLLKRHGTLPFEWVKGHSFHVMLFDLPISAQDDDLCRSLGYRAYRHRKSADGWLVLKPEKVPNPEWPYRAGRIQGNSLFLVGSALYARVPEEAAGYCYCSQMWGDRPRSDYSLHPTV